MSNKSKYFNSSYVRGFNDVNNLAERHAEHINLLKTIVHSEKDARGEKKKKKKKCQIRMSKWLLRIHWAGMNNIYWAKHEQAANEIIKWNMSQKKKNKKKSKQGSSTLSK